MSSAHKALNICFVLFFSWDIIWRHLNTLLKQIIYVSSLKIFYMIRVIMCAVIIISQYLWMRAEYLHRKESLTCEYLFSDFMLSSKLLALCFALLCFKFIAWTHKFLLVFKIHAVYFMLCIICVCVWNGGTVYAHKIAYSLIEWNVTCLYKFSDIVKLL